MKQVEINDTDNADLDQNISDLNAACASWARTSVEHRIEILQQIKTDLLSVSQEWAELAATNKQIEQGSPLVGEEWLSGPYALMTTCNGLIKTLSGMKDKAYLKPLSKRKTVTGQTAVKVLPSSIWDHILYSGMTAEVWMDKSVTPGNLPEHSAAAYDVPPDQRAGGVALILGAGNIASIAPLDCFQKLFLENQSVLLKLNPVNDYLFDVLQASLKSLVAIDALRIVKGDGAIGAYLTNHSGIAEIHITGAEATHDLIVWGAGAEGKAAKKSGKPLNTRRITSELGAVCPTIVVPGPWSKADIGFQAQHLATQKMHNSGFNCIACQVLIMPKTWEKTAPLKATLQAVIQKEQRLAYYPHTQSRLNEFATHSSNPTKLDRGDAPDFVISQMGEDKDNWIENNEIFGPALGIYEISEDDPERYLRAAIAYANQELHGTLGGNIIVHPKTIRQIGKDRFEELIAEFRYGCIAINSWAGVGFLLHQTSWGAFPGHTLDNVSSGIGTVHNTYMFDRAERSVIQQPWRPFPRSFLAGEFTLMPKPPWFITNKRQDKIGALLTRFQYRPSIWQLPRIIWNALRG